MSLRSPTGNEIAVDIKVRHPRMFSSGPAEPLWIPPKACGNDGLDAGLALVIYFQTHEDYERLVYFMLRNFPGLREFAALRSFSRQGRQAGKVIPT
jgi:hypothetical protein